MLMDIVEAKWRYGLLVTVRISDEKIAHSRRPLNPNWVCKCDCGKITVQSGDALALGEVRSCGCLLAGPRGTHTQSVYQRWLRLKNNYYNRSSSKLYDYGRRGIKIDRRWGESFFEFYRDMGEPPPGTILMRSDMNEDFTFENCYWGKRKKKKSEKI